MRKIYLFLLLSLLMAACSDDNNQKEQPVFVTNIVISDADKTFNPGDIVTVKADGFLEGDQLIFEIRWPMPDEPGKEGYSLGEHAVITERTATSISFLAPGHWPASTVKILLERTGGHMLLGQISVADGQSSAEPQLYGITNSRSLSTPDAPCGIIRYDLATKEMSEVVRFNTGEDFRHVSNIPGTNILCGIQEKDGETFVTGYDLCMNYWRSPAAGRAIALCSSFNNIVSVEMVEDNLLTCNLVSYSVYTRLNMPSKPSPTISIPDGLKPESLSRYKGVMADAHLLLSADNGDGTFSPVVINIAKQQLRRYDPIKTEALIPFWVMEPDPKEPKTLQCKGGYIISRANGGDTQFCLWDTGTGTMQAPFATFPNGVRSATMYYSKDGKTRRLYVQFAGYREGDYIDYYDWQTKEWELFTFFVPFAEIVLAR